MTETYLTLSIGGLPPYSSRGCRQTLAPIKSAEVHRTVNGELVTTVSELHHKYKTIIKGQDKLPVALDNLWKGQDIIVGCMQFLWQKTEDLIVELKRAPVAGSVIAINEHRRPVTIVGIREKKITLEQPAYVGYRPILNMKIIDFGYETEEWGEGIISWYLKLEEV